MTLEEEHSLRIFQNRAVRKTFGPKRDDVTVHSMHDVHSPPNTVSVEGGGVCGTSGEHAHTVLIGKLDDF